MIALPVLLSRLKIVPHNPTPVKGTTYECGLNTIGRSWVQFNPRYYFFALMMVAMDVMAVALFPWAAVLRSLGAAGLVSALVFIGIISLGYAYAWNKRALVWR